MAALFTPRYQAEDANGLPYSGALLYFYLAGTSTPTTVYQDAAATTPHTNPVVADSAGVFAAIFVPIGTSVKVVLKTAAGVTLTTVDHVTVGSGISSIVPGAGIIVDDTDPENPIISAVGSGAGLAASVSASALTIALKGADGNNPSASNPVSFAFRDVSLPVGTPSVVTATAALSLVISSGSTMGFTSATAGRLWIVIFNDGGTLRLGAINCRNGTDIYPLGGTKIASSIAEGGAGAADSAHVIYTGTAVASKAYKVLGFMDWAAGLTTAGTWAIVPTTIKLYDLGDKLPGDVIQSVSGTTQTNTTVSSTTFADTTSTVTMTPTAAPNVVSVFANGALGILAASADKRSQARISRGGTQIGIGVQNEVAAAGTVILPAAIAAMDAPGTAAACTWKVQINCTDASQTGFWGHSGLGTVTGAYMSATEIMG